MIGNAGRALRGYGLMLVCFNILLGMPAMAAQPVTILALGDSLTAGYMLPARASFPAQLEAALSKRGHAVRVINAGVSGDTAAGGLARLDWALGDKPDIAIVELGANDMLRGLDPVRTEAVLDQIITRLKAEKVRVLLAGMLASPSLGKEYKARFDAIYPALAKKHGVGLYPFFLQGVASDPKLNLPDGMHPNEAGVARIVEGILPSVEALLAQPAG